MEKKLKTVLPKLLGKDFVVINRNQSKRTLILKDIAVDLQVGFVVDGGQFRGTAIETVQIGVRIPSVERLCDEYDRHRMREMGFRDPEPPSWLTFWRSTFSSMDMETQGLEVDSIHGEFVQLYDSIMADPVGFRTEMLDLLSNACLPDWATAPSSTLLVTKILALRKVFNPAADPCLEVNQLVMKVADTEGYEGDVEKFCHWLRSLRDEDGLVLSNLP